MNNCKGFSLVETMAAFSMWSLIVTILIPQLVLLTQERINTEQSVKAYKILHEKTQQVMYNEFTMENETFMSEKMEYTLTWEEENEYTKACLHWTNTYNKGETICFLVS